MKERIKYINEGGFVAEVGVDLIETEDGWSPGLSVEDAYKLDDVRSALRNGDVSKAVRLARVFKKEPVTV